MVHVFSKAQKGRWKNNCNIKKATSVVSSHTFNILKEEVREHKWKEKQM